jgi:hypothetical protein
MLHEVYNGLCRFEFCIAQVPDHLRIVSVLIFEPSIVSIPFEYIRFQ